MRSSRIIHAADALSVAAAGVAVSMPAAADLEPAAGYGDDGLLEVTVLDEVGAVAVNGDGRTVLFGGLGADLAFARLLPDGTLDASFADDGIARVSYRPSPPLELAGRGAAPQSVPPGIRAGVAVADVRVLADGSIVAAGELLAYYDLDDGREVFSYQYGLVKIDADGTPLVTPTLPEGSGMHGTRWAFVGDDGTAAVMANGGCNGCDVVMLFRPDGSQQGGWGDADEIDWVSEAFTEEFPGCEFIPIYGTSLVVAALSAEEVVLAATRYTAGLDGCPDQSAGVVVRRPAGEGAPVWTRGISDVELMGEPMLAAGAVTVPLRTLTTTGTSEGLPDGEVLDRFAYSNGAPDGGFGTAGRLTLSAAAPWLATASDGNATEVHSALLASGDVALLVTDNGAPATDTTPARATSVKTVVVEPSAAVVHESVQPTASMEEVLWGRAIKALPGGGYTALASATTWDDGGTPDDPGDDTRTQTGWVHRFIEPAADIEPLEPGARHPSGAGRQHGRRGVRRRRPGRPRCPGACAGRRARRRARRRLGGRAQPHGGGARSGRLRDLVPVHHRAAQRVEHQLHRRGVRGQRRRRATRRRGLRVPLLACPHARDPRRQRLPPGVERGRPGRAGTAARHPRR